MLDGNLQVSNQRIINFAVWQINLPEILFPCGVFNVIRIPTAKDRNTECTGFSFGNFLFMMFSKTAGSVNLTR